MHGHRTFWLREWWLPLITVTGVAATLVFALSGPERGEVQPPDCSLSPVAYHPGTLVNWKISVNRGGENAEVSALVRLDDGREVIAYNATNDALQLNDRVMVSQIVCVHRTVYLLTEFAAPAAETALGDK